MPSRPLLDDFAAIGLVDRISQLNGGANVAMVVPRHWDGNEANLHAALNTAGANTGHSALVNLVQHRKRRGLGFDDDKIFLNYVPTRADKGIFIEQVRERAIIYLDGGTVRRVVPTKANRNGLAAAVNHPPQHNVPAEPVVEINAVASWWQNIANRGQNPVQITHAGAQYNIPLSPDANIRLRTTRLLAVNPANVTLDMATAAGVVPNIGVLAAPAQAVNYTALNGPGKLLFDKIFVYANLALIPIRKRRHTVGLPLANLDGNEVASMLVRESGEIASWGMNFRGTNPCFHAEVSTVREWQRRQGGAQPFPANSRLYTTLEPCFMCSGLLSMYDPVVGFTVVWTEADPAFAGLNTFLADTGFTRQTVGDLNVTYRNRLDTWTQRLETTRVRLGELRRAQQDDQAYLRSSIRTLADQASQVRRFAKAGLDLLGIGAEIRQKRITNDIDAAAETALLNVWKHAMLFTLRVGGYAVGAPAPTKLLLRQLYGDLGTYLDETVGQNAMRAAALDPMMLPTDDALDYRARVRVADRYRDQAGTAVDNLVL